jgi:Xaa-Pro aminopeptidase
MRLADIAATADAPAVETPDFDSAPFAARRRTLLQRMAEDGPGVAVIPSAGEVLRNRDAHFPFRFDSYFYYLTGFVEPDAVLVLVAGEQPRSILFCLPKDETREIWDGYRHGPEAARQTFAMDEAHELAALDQLLPQWMADHDALWFSLGHDAAWDARVRGWLNAVRGLARSGLRAPSVLRDVRVPLDEMRLIKDASELATMRRAAAISCRAHARAMRFTRPGVREFQVEAELLHEFRMGGAQSPAYGSIVAAGANACVLHYRADRAVCADGELLLIDAGCEVDGYASDITRTFPVSGRFSGPQRECYELVLAAQAAAFAAIAPGRHWNEPHEAAVAVLAQGFIDLGLLQGSLDGVLEGKAYSRFYMHRTGHWLGLDVHDAGDYKLAGEWRPLLPGMVLTVEPGCYIRAAADIDPCFHDIGIRIEDDALVTVDGHENLTLAAPKLIADIEALMRR